MQNHNEILTKLNTFFAQYPQKKFPKNKSIIQAGDNPPNIYYIEDGLVNVHTVTQNGDKVIVNIFQSPAFFPMSWAIGHLPNLYFYQAETEVTCRVAPIDLVLNFIKENPDIMYDLLRRVYIGLDGILLRNSHILSGNKYASVITELIIAAKRFGQRINGTDSIEVKINQNNIAAQSGMARETVSRQMHILKEKNLISYNNHNLVIFNLELLESELLNSD